MTATARIPAATAPELELLRLLLGDPRIDPDDLDWSLMIECAERHRVTRRLERWFAQRHEYPGPPIAEAFTRARENATAVLAHTERLGNWCDQHDIAHVFLNVAQQFPDTSADIDLLVAAPRESVRAAAHGDDPFPPAQTPLRSHLDGTTRHVLPDCHALLEVHYGRLGRFAEQVRYPWELLDRRRRQRLGRVACCVPSREDALLLLVMRRLYGRPELRLADICWSLDTIADGLAWDQLDQTARDAGLLAGLHCFLDCLDAVHRDLLGRPLAGVPMPTEPYALWGEVRFEDGRFRLESRRVSGLLYLGELAADLAAGEFAAAARLCLLPVVAATTGMRRLVHAHGA